MIDPQTPAQKIVDLLNLKPHPEGGRYHRVFEDPVKTASGRAASSSIYYLLEAGEFSHWHRIDSAEIWHYYAGGPLVLSISENGVDVAAHRLGLDFAQGARPQVVVPAGAWQAAESLGRWTLVGCTVAPGFTFDTWELAPPDWRPMPRPASGDGA